MIYLGIFGLMKVHIPSSKTLRTNSDGEEAASFMPQQTEDFVPTQAPPEPEETTNGNFPARKFSAKLGLIQPCARR